MNDGWVQHKNIYITVKMANYDFKNDFPAPYFIPQHSSKFVNRLYDINCIEDSSLQYRFNNSINTHCDFDSQSKPYLGKNIEDNALHDSDDFYENSSSNNINNHSGHHSSIQYDSCHGSIGSSFDGYANYSVNNSAGNYMGNSIRSHGSVNNSVDSSTVDNSDIKYVGLQNQGATCYMNSMLQAFFHLPAFRKLVYFKMPTEGVEDETKNIPLNLQKLFTKMQCSKTSCSTTALTKSFGWNDADTFTQHDVQEFCRVLVDNLETKMKKSELDGEIAKILRGKYNRYIRCVNVDFETSKIEEFYDLSMVVKDTFNLEESFKKYIEPELLSGDNQYQTDKHGKQDVNVGIEFLEFPSALHLHLRRFEFNF
ncbi:hypothetical protein TRFO_33383 [Tritrichomonas foetus]|uniref:USP domain-containing protein n=1 Tax=Tritrichomonas foetus TaxID=1144522 RepID=A0A1J4JLS2_9EUKA|nr:hypothetical protein TRFO_33383 [Tritrichomonas foetus]|eukprot:OHT00035.1 hypothetical protein TRFO_33383 [Tritrichomonas foetus]